MPPMNAFDLPDHLAERVLPLGAAREKVRGEFVLYWAHHALRADKNPALDTAAVIAHRWRHARAKRPLEQAAIWIESMRLALAGDWGHGSRVEGALLSGAAAAGRIMTAAHVTQR